MICHFCRRKTDPAAVDMRLEDAEKRHILHVLSASETLKEASEILGINLSTLWRKRQQYRIEAESLGQDRRIA